MYSHVYLHNANVYKVKLTHILHFTTLFVHVYDPLGIPSIDNISDFAYAYEDLNFHSQIYCIWMPYLFFHMYDHKSISPLAVIFVAVNAYEVLLDSHKCFKFGHHISFFHIYDHLFIL